MMMMTVMVVMMMMVVVVVMMITGDVRSMSIDLSGIWPGNLVKWRCDRQLALKLQLLTLLLWQTIDQMEEQFNLIRSMFDDNCLVALMEAIFWHPFT